MAESVAVEHPRVRRRHRAVYGATQERVTALGGSALHVMLFLENLIRALLIFNGLRSRQRQRALLVSHYRVLARAMLGKSPLTARVDLTGGLCWSIAIAG